MPKLTPTTAMPAAATPRMSVRADRVTRRDGVVEGAAASGPTRGPVAQPADGERAAAVLGEAADHAVEQRLEHPALPGGERVGEGRERGAARGPHRGRRPAALGGEPEGHAAAVGA